MASSFIHRARRLGLSPLLACAALAGGLAYTAGAQAESWNRTLADVRLVKLNGLDRGIAVVGAASIGAGP